MNSSSTDSHTIPVAVLFLVFNRPDTTAKVFDAIRASRPTRLYVASDGPRKDRLGEVQTVERVRSLATQVDWPCEVKTLFRDKNLGCKVAVSSAISWFFDQEPEGIVLEDDCLPGPDFFQYCVELLGRYREDERVGLICGTSLCDIRAQSICWGGEDYLYTRYPSVWGWASWRRVWKHYDVTMASWAARREDVSALTHNSKLNAINASLFDRVSAGKIDTWDYQVSYLLWTTNRLAVAPRFNLIENIGFGVDATHTKTAGIVAERATLGQQRLTWPLLAPPTILPNIFYQHYLERFATRSFLARIFERLLTYVR
jgi:hypothetical protein